MTDRLSPITLERIDPDAVKVIRRLTRNEYQAYLVGGCVRDLLLGRTPKDFDVATNATPPEIRKLFRNCRIIGRRFRLAHIFFGPKIIETSTFRADPGADADANGEDPMIWQDNVFGTAEEDARRRDFTINGLFFDLASGQVLDTVGGMADVRAGLVRTIGDPQRRFREDPVRILRAVKFAARLELRIETETEAAMIEQRGLIARCSVARVLEEIYRILGSGSAAPAFALMHRTGVLAVLFPEVAATLAPPDSPTARQVVAAIRPTRRRRLELVADGADELAFASEANGAGDELPEPPAPLAEGAPEDAPFDERAEAESLMEAIGLARLGPRAAAGSMVPFCLEAVDRLVVQARTDGHEPLSHAVLLGSLLAPLAGPALVEELTIGETVERIDQLVASVATRLQVSRRDRERLRHILVAQRRLAQARPRQAIRDRDYFAEAMQLLELRDAVTGEFASAIEQWNTLEQKHRRGGRKRRRRRGAAAATEAHELLVEALEDELPEEVP
ncbi:MAG: polynucleotide adenylyltransferase PcnB [Deltaproteobacteria bacterium]|nr:polynucleotide adenylyltransferase PcnB [Deltaproteobacteria bacterium]